MLLLTFLVFCASMSRCKLGTLSLPFHCAVACLFLPPSIIHGKTAMSQKRTDIEQKKEVWGGGVLKKTRTRWIVAII